MADSGKLKLKKYGWRKDSPDFRDWEYETVFDELSPEVDLRSFCPVVWDQGELGSGVAQALAALIQISFNKNAPKLSFQPSALFLYYVTRVIENSVNEDTGIEIRNAIKCLAKGGICSEFYHPYIVSGFKKKPHLNTFANVFDLKIKGYYRLSSAAVCECLDLGKPVVFGFSAYESFESEAVANTGIVELPDAKERLLGGQAGVLVGYDEDKFLVRNSVGSKWGQNGYFTLPADYVHNPGLAGDFWTIDFDYTE